MAHVGSTTAAHMQAGSRPRSARACKAAPMRTYYFIGGPTPGNEQTFFRRLEVAGGLPAGWSIYPHVGGDGKALHIARAESADAITSHLALFADIYESTGPVEVIDDPKGQART